MPSSHEVSAPAALQPLEAPYAKLSPGPGKNAVEVAENQRTRIHNAMLEIVAEHGYSAVTVRDLARLAHISSRAFYQHFSSKEECFLQAHELVVRKAAKRTIASQAGERDWQEQLRLACRAFMRELERDQRAARLALIDVHAAGPQAHEQTLWAERIFAAMIGESFDRAPDDIAVSPLVTRSLVAGVASVARSHVLWGWEQQTDSLGDKLAQWILDCRREQAAALSDLAGEATTEPPTIPASEGGDETRLPAGDRGLILSATAKLAACGGYGNLTLAGIRTAAGVTRKTFDAHFDGVEDCVIAAAESLAEEAFARAGRAKASAQSWEEGVHLTMVALCEQVARDPVLAKLCFVDVTALGPAGLHCRERFVAEIGDLICYGAPNAQSPDDVATEASAGAIWGMTSELVVSGRQRQLPQVAPTLASLALAPSRQRLPVPGLG